MKKIVSFIPTHYFCNKDKKWVELEKEELSWIEDTHWMSFVSEIVEVSPEVIAVFWKKEVKTGTTFTLYKGKVGYVKSYNKFIQFIPSEEFDFNTGTWNGDSLLLHKCWIDLNIFKNMGDHIKFVRIISENPAIAVIGFDGLFKSNIRMFKVQYKYGSE